MKSLKDALKSWLDHRQIILQRKSKYRLNCQSVVFSPTTTEGGPVTGGLSPKSGSTHPLLSGRLTVPRERPAEVQVEAELAFFMVCSISSGFITYQVIHCFIHNASISNE